MATLANRRLEKFAQFCASGLNNSEAYRQLSGRDRNADVHAAELMGKSGVRERVAELQKENARRAQMTRDELLAFYAEVIRTPADQVPAGSPIIQAYEETANGHKIRVVDKAAAGAALAKMCGWDVPTKIVVTTDPLLRYLQELRGTPINGRPVECEPRQLEAPLQEETFDESQDVGA
jgi:Terminase small subunit